MDKSEDDWPACECGHFEPWHGESGCRGWIPGTYDRLPGKCGCRATEGELRRAPVMEREIEPPEE